MAINGRSNLVDVKVARWLVDRPQSVLILTEDGKRVWLAKSTCEINEDDGTVTMSEALAIEKELV